MILDCFENINYKVSLKMNKSVLRHLYSIVLTKKLVDANFMYFFEDGTKLNITFDMYLAKLTWFKSDESSSNKKVQHNLCSCWLYICCTNLFYQFRNWYKHKSFNLAIIIDRNKRFRHFQIKNIFCDSHQFQVIGLVKVAIINRIERELFE